MADNVKDPSEVGGIQKIFCPVCTEEVKPLDSYHLNFKNERVHYPVCYQRACLAESE